MKFKVVAEARDILIFIIFAIFLLYVVALGVLNFQTLAATGRFFGINPIPAFSPDNLTYTIFFYIFSLAGLFMSVSSYFFEMESGFGVSSSKKEKGYTRWAKDKEMYKELKCVHPTDEKSEYAGVPLISNGKELWVDDGEFHNLVIGATGSGKTQSTILPAVKVLAKKGESIICTDPKGEIYEKTGGLLKAKGYNIILLNFRNPQRGNAWNPITLPYRLYKNDNKDKAIELLDDLALNILYEENSGNADPFWEKTSADYFSGLTLGMFEDTTEDKININSISLTTTVGEDKCGGSTYVKEYFGLKDPNSAAYINASGTIMAPNETKGSIIAVFKQKIKLFSSRENLSEMLSYSDFDMEDIGKKPTAVFIIIQDEKKTYHSLATIFVKQCYETLIDVAQQNGGKLPCRTNFLLDEFANMPPLKDVTTMITAARSRQIRFTLIIQNFAQLTQVYGKENAETIKGNCGNLIYLISTELAALEEISKLCGEVKSKKDDKTASTPLVTVSDLQRMKQFDQIVLRMRSHPFKTSFVPDFKINWGNTKYEKVDYPEREKKPVQVFDIREYVKEKKQQKIKEMMGEAGNAAPGGAMPPFPAPAPTPVQGAFPPPAAAPAPYGGEELIPAPRPIMQPVTDSVSTTPKPAPKPIPDFDVNDLVKKIDAKIAAMEAEEKKNKEEAKEQPKEVVKEEIIEEPKLEPIAPKPIYESTNNGRSALLPLEEPRKEMSTQQIPSNDVDEYKPLISSGVIENKVNNIIASRLLSTEEEVKPQAIEKVEPVVEMDRPPIGDITRALTAEPIIPTENAYVPNKPTPTIRLEDVKEDDKFFDDFFED